VRRSRTSVTGVTLLLLAGLFALPTPVARAATGLIPFAEGLDFPAAFTFAPDGRVFYAERLTGKVRILAADASTDDLFVTVPGLWFDQGSGVLGIALHPAYPGTPQVYVYVTRDIGGAARNQILRYTDTGGTGTNMELIWDGGLDAGHRHRGGRILFGPDGMLYALQGDTSVPGYAQRLTNTAGKVLRMTPDGAVPGDNPFPGNLIYAYGFRNSYGFDFDPVSGVLWESENGPACNDELNRIPEGRNMGWGRHQECDAPPNAPRNTNQDGPTPVMPERWYTPTIAPTGVAFCDGCGLPNGEGRLFMADWNTGTVRRVRLDAARKEVAEQRKVVVHDDGLMSIEVAPDGRLYVSDPDGIYLLAVV